MTALTGIHHLKFPVSDLAAAVDWYGRALGARRIERFDHREKDGTLFGVILEVPGLPMPLELRLNPAAAAAISGFDPVTFAVADEAALSDWVAHLDAAGVAHSGVIHGFIGSLITFAGPDGLALRLYTEPPGGFDEVEMNEDAGLGHPGLG